MAACRGALKALLYEINDSGQAVGFSYVDGSYTATEWSNGSAINLGGLPGSTFSMAYGINNAGQVVGESDGPAPGDYATEWSSGSVINLGGLPGNYRSSAFGINSAGQVVGASDVVEGPAVHVYATSGATVP